MANEIYRVLGTTVVWTDSGGDELLDLGDGVIGLAGAVGVGAYHDWGAGAQPDGFILLIDIDGFVTNPSIGRTVEVHITESANATVWTGPEAPADTDDSTGNVNRLPNLLGPFVATVRSTVAADRLTARYEYRSTARYSAPVVYNNTAQNMKTSGDTHRISITPFWYQVQS